MPAMKPRRFLSSAPAVLEALGQRCDRRHRHQVLEGSGRLLQEDGSQTELWPGQAFLVPANLGLRLEAQEDLCLYRTCLGD